MTDDELNRHLRDILACAGVNPGQANTVARARLRLAVDAAVMAERERCVAICVKLAAECNLQDSGEVFGFNRLSRVITAIRALPGDAA